MQDTVGYFFRADASCVGFKWLHGWKLVSVSPALSSRGHHELYLLCDSSNAIFDAYGPS